ncbi:MAG: hypothetical protein KatS3mg068_1504 [Candidatus Sericytochromatia bacterium]|nr:MAG: hypothetical protein KatS3mg068_1504 [Candidatus Sericytochromatia bacterium]
MANVFNFKNKDFQDIYNELEQKYPNQPKWFKELIASLFDIMYWYLDMAIQDLFPSTMISTRNMQNLIKMFGYNLKYMSSAYTVAKLNLTSVSSGITIPKEKLVFRLRSDTGKNLTLSGYQDLIIPNGVSEINVNLLEGEFKYNVELGFHDGSQNLEFVLPYSNIDVNFLKVYVDGVEWSRIDDLINSTPSGKHYQFNLLSGNRVSIQFGDGNFGEIPPVNSYITCDLLLSSGASGNFRINVPYTLEFSNYVEYPIIDRYNNVLLQDLSGGSDIENIIQAKDLAILNIRSFNGATTEDSIKSLAFKYSSSIYDVLVLPAYFGQYSVAVAIIPYGGGLPSNSLKVALQNYLISKSLLGFSNIVVIDPFYVPVNINLQVSMRSGFSFSTYSDCIKFVCALSVCENQGEYLQYYRLRDWNRIFQVANTQFGFNLTDLYSNYLIPVFDYLLRKGRRNFGDSFIKNDLITMILNLNFINSVNILQPTSDISGLGFNEITTLGSLSVGSI